jgi:hypothetical protein
VRDRLFSSCRLYMLAGPRFAEVPHGYPRSPGRSTLVT